jgi:surface protein
MFSNSEFNGDISRWDVSKVTDMSGMFSNSEFNGDISRWDVPSIEYLPS